MADTPKKQTFLHGTMLLAMATAIVKVIGALYKLPLNAIIGPEGFGYFNTAYDIYNVLLMISTAGLPVAMSRMISQASSLQHYRQVRKIYNTAKGIFLTLGIVGTLLMTLLCKELAAFQEQPDAWVAIGALGPCCLLICLMSAYRGFFQGQGNMLPTSISQILEAVCKLVVGIVAAVAVYQTTHSIPFAAGGAILGVTASCLISSLYLGDRFRKAYKALPESFEELSSGKEIAKGLLLIAVPITIGSAGLQILTMLETKIYMEQLKIYLTQDIANIQKGVYNMTQTIFNMPCAFITPITISIIPAITSQLTTGHTAAAKETAQSAARVTALISAPCAVGLAVLAEPVTALLGGYTADNLALATRLMTILGVCILFNAAVLLTNAIMQAHGHVGIPVINMFVGGIIKLVTISILTRNPHIGILGAPIGTLLCYLSITLLNLISMRRALEQTPSIVKNMLRSVLAALIMGAAVLGVSQGLHYIPAVAGSSLIRCFVPLLVGVSVYVLAALKLKAITKEDCILLPKGERIAQILHL